jgi:hypothetical protein
VPDAIFSRASNGWFAVTLIGPTGYSIP